MFPFLITILKANGLILSRGEPGLAIALSSQHLEFLQKKTYITILVYV